MNLKFQVEDRLEIVKEYQNGMPVNAVCKKHDISKSSVYNWLRLDSNHVSSNRAMKISFREIISLQSEVARLRQENEILKKCNCTVSSQLAEKLAAIDLLKENYSIHVLCRTLSILRSTYCHHSLRSPEKTIFEISDEKIRSVVKQIFEDSKGRFGTRKIKAALEQQGYSVSLKMLRRLMKELNLSCKQSQLKYFSS